MSREFYSLYIGKVFKHISHVEQEDKLEFVEIYFKGDKESEERDRIERYYK